MDLKAWLNDNGAAYVALLAASLVGVALLVSYTITAIAGITFEPIDSIFVAALTSIFAVLAMEHSKSTGNENGA